MEQDADRSEGVRSYPSKNGKALIFNMKNQREGTEEDVKRLCKVFQILNISVLPLLRINTRADDDTDMTTEEVTFNLKQGSNKAEAAIYKVAYKESCCGLCCDILKIFQKDVPHEGSHY
ncbi:unnamed protein product [Darwinula stevensoni]|uniref:Uncharacterized protein n=1 Tax=Darwinula stevensoni TaxID=69355 RepID=A0A7R8XAD7_9CRUS|nr:unnamed protein product [Darwinula stevensoni]CAG0890562.1 unnamed protein product [Darwinula stevensoni]